MRYQEETQASDGDMGEYIGSSSEEVDAPVSVGTKRDYTRQRTAAPGLVNGEGGGDMLVDDSPWTAATSQGRKRGTTGGGPGRRRGAGGGGAGAADLTGAVEHGFDPRRTDGGGVAGGAGGGGPGGQQEVGGGGGFWQNDDDGMGVGRGSTSTSAAGTEAVADDGTSK